MYIYIPIQLIKKEHYVFTNNTKGKKLLYGYNVTKY